MNRKRQTIEFYNKKNKPPQTSIHKVLFVCNGNVFRSFSAGALLKHYLDEHKIKGWEIFSAGTLARKQKIDLQVIAKLKMFGVKNMRHKPIKLNKSILKKFDLVIAMAEDQITFMKNKFNYTDAMLFNEIANNEKTSILDIDEVKDYLTNKKSVERKINETIQYIHDNIPKIVKGITQHPRISSNFLQRVKSKE